MNLSAAQAMFVLMKWYHENARSLPWRSENPDPYRVWISEIMSQQSTLKTVEPYFCRWMERFPSLQQLAVASETEVLRLWAGLGYYSRARNVLKAARSLHELGRWPASSVDWQRVPGVGPYTSKAISAIVRNEPVLAVDGNVIRVLSRLYGIRDPLNNRRDDRRLKEIVETWEQELSTSKTGLRSGDIVQSLMDLGATVCRPRNLALCEACPLCSACRSFNDRGSVSQTPQPKLRKKSVKILSLVLLYHDENGAWLVRRRPTQMRMAGFWEFPTWEIGLDSWAEAADLEKSIAQNFDIIGKFSHSITHHRYRILAIRAGKWRGAKPWGHRFGFDHGTVTTVTRKILRKISEISS